ncbi:hypothetical protein DRQ50_07115 [bacterium]|nr:MAG: hypothetical protein DRQ50_07115 [bacterium]
MRAAAGGTWRGGRRSPPREGTARRPGAPGGDGAGGFQRGDQRPQRYQGPRAGARTDRGPTGRRAGVPMPERELRLCRQQSAAPGMVRVLGSGRRKTDT